MLRGLIWTLRQRRYAALALGMFVLAAGCAGAGTFEVHRLQEKRSDNSRLIANAHAAAAALTPALLPLTNGRPVDALAVRYRTVTTAGRYDTAAQVYVGNQSQGGRQGFWVLTPLRSRFGTLLVVRGFVAATAGGTRPAHVAPPPPGRLHITGRLAAASGSAARFGKDEVSAIDAQQEAQRLGAPVYQAYLALNPGQPGSAGLRPLPGPALSNPTGGASEWQLISYVVQWYVFAALALAAPFLFARAEIRAARRRLLGFDPDRDDVDLRAAPQPALGPASGSTTGTDLAVRGGGTVAKLSNVDAGVRRRAARLADRYGLSLGPDADSDKDAVAEGPTDHPVDPASAGPRRRIGGVPDVPDPPAGIPTRGSAGLSRSPDAYHGSYNDYLWLLALADGEAPEAGAPDPGPRPAPGLPRPPEKAIDGRTIDGVLAEPDDDDQSRP